MLSGPERIAAGIVGAAVLGFALYSIEAKLSRSSDSGHHSAAAVQKHDQPEPAKPSTFDGAKMPRLPRF